MTEEAPTQLIERSELQLLVAASRSDAFVAHTIRRPREATVPPAATSPSALRGALWLVAGAWLARELLQFLF